MAHVPLPFRGVAVLFLAASAALGQTPEPPAEFSLDSNALSSPDLLRQFSTETNNPLLHLMVNGELTSYEADPPKDSTKLKPTPQTPAASKTAPADDCPSDCGPIDGCPVEIVCPTAPNFLPYACPSQCNCRKCQRQRSRGHCCGNGYGNGYGNPDWGGPNGLGLCFYGAPLVPCDGCCKRKCCWTHSWGRKGCAKQGQGCAHGHGGWCGWNTMCGDGFLDGDCCGWMPFACSPPQQHCNCRLFQRKHNCGHSGYGYPNCGYIYGGCWDGCSPYVAPPPPPSKCHCRWCQRKNSSCGYGYYGGYGYQGCGYPGWDGDGDGCGKHHRGFGLFRNCHCKQPPPPCPYYGCSTMGWLDGDGAFGSDF